MAGGEVIENARVVKDAMRVLEELISWKERAVNQFSHSRTLVNGAICEACAMYQRQERQKKYFLPLRILQSIKGYGFISR